jgi:hypothetical protein
VAREVEDPRQEASGAGVVVGAGVLPVAEDGRKSEALDALRLTLEGLTVGRSVDQARIPPGMITVSEQRAVSHGHFLWAFVCYKEQNRANKF